MILDMVEHCHLEFIRTPYQQYPMPPIRFNSSEAAIIDGEIQQLLSKGVLEETERSYGQYISTIFLRKKKNGSTTVCYLNAMGGTKSPHCNKLAKSVWMCCMQNDIWLSACHLPGVLNIEADKSSRQFNERTEWQLNPDIFHKISNVLGTPEIDVFASRLNTQLPTYVSWKPDPEVSQVDAFSFSWNGRFVYIFPPFSLLNRCLQKLEKDQALALLVAPIWPTQVWWPRLLRLLVATPLLLPQHKDLLSLPHSGAQHPLRNQMSLMACLLSGNTMKQEEYRSQLLDYSCHLGEGVPRNNIQGTSKSGQHFVSKGKSVIFNQL